jgi:hypothetical protein
MQSIGVLNLRTAAKAAYAPSPTRGEGAAVDRRCAQNPSSRLEPGSLGFAII